MDQDHTTPTMLSTGEIHLRAMKWTIQEAERRAAKARPEPIPEELLDIIIMLFGDEPDERQ